MEWYPFSPKRWQALLTSSTRLTVAIEPTGPVASVRLVVGDRADDDGNLTARVSVPYLGALKIALTSDAVHTWACRRPHGDAPFIARALIASFPNEDTYIELKCGMDGWQHDRSALQNGFYFYPWPHAWHKNPDWIPFVKRWPLVVRVQRCFVKGADAWPFRGRRGYRWGATARDPADPKTGWCARSNEHTHADDAIDEALMQVGPYTHEKLRHEKPAGATDTEQPTAASRTPRTRKPRKDAP